MSLPRRRCEPIAFLARPRDDCRVVKDFGEIQMSEYVTDWGGLPTLLRKGALVPWGTSAVTSKEPKAPPPFTWYTRSGTRSRTKWASFSFRCSSDQHCML